jgi:hypothetical protein
MTEAVIMLPAFALLWAVYIFVAGAYEKAVDVGAENRRRALAHVVDYCHPGSQPGSAVMSQTDPGGELQDHLVDADNLLGPLDTLRDRRPDLQMQVGTYTDQTVVEADALVDNATVNVVHGVTFVCREREMSGGGDLEVPPVVDELWREHGRERWP